MLRARSALFQPQGAVQSGNAVLAISQAKRSRNGGIDKLMDPSSLGRASRRRRLNPGSGERPTARGDALSVKQSQVRARVQGHASPEGGASVGEEPSAEASAAPRATAKDERAIMVVDDDHDLRTTIQQELEERGYVVYGAANGMEALNLLRLVPPPRLILLDLMMPIMNGWDFLQSMKDDAALAQIPVTVLTWLRHTTMPDSRVLTKPLDLRTLLDLIEEHAVA